MRLPFLLYSTVLQMRAFSGSSAQNQNPSCPCKSCSYDIKQIHTPPSCMEMREELCHDTLFLVIDVTVCRNRIFISPVRNFQIFKCYNHRPRSIIAVKPDRYILRFRCFGGSKYRPASHQSVSDRSVFIQIISNHWS